jgi:hypothetical protein
MRRILIIAFICVPSFAIAGEQLDSLFTHAGIAYSEGKYELAIALYDEILQQGFESPELYYNLGNASFRSNKLGYAILYYNKSLKLDPNYEESRNNLEYVSLFKEDKLERVPEFFLKTWIKSLFQLFSLKLWSYFSLALFGLFLFGTITYVFAPSLLIKKLGFSTGVLALFFFIISFSAAISRNHEITRPVKGILVAPSVVVKSTPSDSGTELFVLHEGTAVVKEETVGEWTEIRIIDGRIGWIPTNSYEII